MHKRFKTQPGGKPESPYINISTPNHRLTDRQYQQVMSQAAQVGELNGVCDFRLINGIWLRQYPGQISKRFFISHPAKEFALHARKLRMAGIPCITVDNFFRIPAKKISAVTYFVPEGKLMGSLSTSEIPLKELAALMARLHDLGIDCTKPEPDMFVTHQETIGVMDPTNIRFMNSPVSLKKRRETIISLSKHFHLNGDDTDTLFSSYAEAAGLNMTRTTRA